MVMARGIRMTAQEWDAIVPMLFVFTSLFGYLLVTIHDTGIQDVLAAKQQNFTFLLVLSEFYGNCSGAWMPFSLSDLVPMSLALRDVSLGLIELAFPESRPSLAGGYEVAIRSVNAASDSAAAVATEIGGTKTWSQLFSRIVELLRQLYTRDTRRQFCPDLHWICPNISLPVKRSAEQSFRNVGRMRPFQNLRLVPEGEGK
jgi:ubiquitin-protein ligase E3 C